MGTGLQADDTVVAKQAVGEEWNECLAEFRAAEEYPLVLMFADSRMILESHLMK